MSTSQFNPKDSGPSGNEYLDMLIRVCLAGHLLHQPPYRKEKHYIMREQRIRLDEVYDPKKCYVGYETLEHYDVSLPLDETVDDLTNSWYSFDFYVFRKREGDRPDDIWIRLANRDIGFECNLNKIQYDAYLKLKLAHS